MATVLAWAGAALGQPVDDGAPSCTRASQQLATWDVVDVYLRPGGGNGSAVDDISFGLDNAAVGYRATCSAKASHAGGAGFTGDVDYPCRMPPGYDRASFRFSRATGRLSIRHRWFCLAERTGFQGEGGATLSLDCAGPAPTGCAKLTAEVPVESLGAFA